MQKEDRYVLIGVNGLIRKLSKSASGIKLIKKSEDLTNKHLKKELLTR